MKHPMHTPVVEMIEQAIATMDELMRGKIDLDVYAAKLDDLDVDALLEKHGDDFKQDASLVYYLDALMMLSSLQHELDFQVAEYGASVASEDIRMLKDILVRLNRHPDH